jgi:hypothetical protein
MAEYVRDPTTGLITLWNGYNGTPERAQHRYRRDPATGLATSRELVPTPDFGEMYVTDANGLLTPVRNLYDPTALVFDFANGYYQDGAGHWSNDPSLIPGWTYSPRTGTEYASTSSGLLVPFASGVPAVTDLGLQVWEARTNLVLQSNTLNNASWTNNANISFGTPGTFIDGTSTFALLTATSTNACRAEVGPITVASGATYTLSAYFKAGSANGFIRWKTATTQAQFKLNLSSGATTAGPSNSGNAATVTLTQVSTGIWRATLTVAADATSVAVAVGIWDGTADQFGYPGTTSGTTVYAGGVQLEAAAFPGPYIPTTSSSATRGAASASVGGLSLPSEFTLFLEGATADPNGLFPVLAQIDGAADTNRVQVFAAPGAATTVGGLRVDSGGVVQANLSSANTAANGANLRLAASIKASRMALSMNGGAVSAGSGVVPSTTTLRIGNNFGAGAAWNGNIKRAVIYPYAMSDAQLQALTQ